MSGKMTAHQTDPVWYIHRIHLGDRDAWMVGERLATAGSQQEAEDLAGDLAVTEELGTVIACPDGTHDWGLVTTSAPILPA